MVKMSKRLVSSRASTYAGTNGRKYITIHETDNTSKGANADAHARLQLNGFAASWHWQVDDKQAIQSYPHSVRCYHAGDGRGTGNYESIGIEICVNSDGNYAKAVQNAIELVRHIMKQEGIPASRVVQHNYWSGKNCPRNLRSGARGINWAEFKKAIGSTAGTVSKPSKPSQNTPSTKPKEEAKKPEKLAVDGYWGHATTRALQAYFGTKVDGIISGQPNNGSVRNIPSARIGFGGSQLVMAMQKFYKSGSVDGLISDPSQLIIAMQKKYGTTVDGHVSKQSQMVMELQKRLNKGKL